jgi:hypothetical protein
LGSGQRALAALPNLDLIGWAEPAEYLLVAAAKRNQ